MYSILANCHPKLQHGKAADKENQYTHTLFVSCQNITFTNRPKSAYKRHQD